MIQTLYEKHKKACLIIAVILVALLLGLYLSALYQPGYWYLDAFLAKQEDGSFAASDAYGSYYLKVDRADDSASVTFSIDDLTKEYLITGTATGEDVHIYENDALVFHGYKARMSSSEYTLMGYDGYFTSAIHIFAGNTKPDPEELLPSYSTLYNWASSDKAETRGEPAMLLLILFLGIVLALDVTFPDLFFTLRYRHYVTGGEPSDWYRAGQKMGRFIMAIAILICMFRSLYPF